MKKVICLCLLVAITVGCSQTNLNKAEISGSTIELRSEPFKEALKNENILYYKTEGEILRITMQEDIPNDITISFTLLNQKATPLFGKNYDSNVEFTKDKDTLTFAVDPVELYSLSSISDIKEKSYIGYTIRSIKKDKTWYVLVGMKK